MCDVVFIGVGDYDLDRVILETLRLVDRHGVGHLERHGGVQRVVILVACVVVVVVDREANCRATRPFELITDDVELAERSIELNIEFDPATIVLDANNSTLQVVTAGQRAIRYSDRSPRQRSGSAH